jgi:hypothetical protein
MGEVRLETTIWAAGVDARERYPADSTGKQGKCRRSEHREPRMVETEARS